MNRREPPRHRLPIVGVMGSSVHPHRTLAVPLVRGLARLGVHLLTGGGGGAMASVSRAFAEVENRAGLVIGVLPRREDGDAAGPEPGRANPWVELAVHTHLGRDGASHDSRNHINVLTSDVVVALPGGAGTASEVELAVRYGRPAILFGDLERARRFPAEVAAAATVEEVVGFVGERLLGAS